MKLTYARPKRQPIDIWFTEKDIINRIAAIQPYLSRGDIAAGVDAIFGRMTRALVERDEVWIDKVLLLIPYGEVGNRRVKFFAARALGKLLGCMRTDGRVKYRFRRVSIGGRRRAPWTVNHRSVNSQTANQQT